MRSAPGRAGCRAARSAPGAASAGDHLGSRPPEGLAQAVERALHDRRADQAVQQVGRAESEPHAGGDARRSVGAATSATRLRERARAASAQRLDQQARLDADRARGGAQPAGGAGVDAVVVVERASASRALADRSSVALEPRDLAPADDALARRQRQAARRALRLAEAALDALVDDRIARRAAASGSSGARRGRR